MGDTRVEPEVLIRPAGDTFATDGRGAGAVAEAGIFSSVI